VAAWQAAGFPEVVLKVPFSLAGRGMLRIRQPGLQPHETAWLTKALATQGSIVVEPWLDRMADFSAHYDCEPGKRPKLRGLVRLHCDAAGRFVACVASRSFGRNLPGGVARLWEESGAQGFYEEELPALLARHCDAASFRGWLGIDALVHRLPDGSPRIRPIVEINPRATMGRMTLELRRCAAPESPVAWRIFHDRAMQAAGCQTPAGFARSWSERFPLKMNTLSGGKIIAGAFSLNDPEAAERFVGIVAVGDEAVRALSI
jgi:hypothetical protein